MILKSFFRKNEIVYHISLVEPNGPEQQAASSGNSVANNNYSLINQQEIGQQNHGWHLHPINSAQSVTNGPQIDNVRPMENRSPIADHRSIDNSQAIDDSAEGQSIDSDQMVQEITGQGQIAVDIVAGDEQHPTNRQNNTSGQ